MACNSCCLSFSSIPVTDVWEEYYGLIPHRVKMLYLGVAPRGGQIYPSVSTKAFQNEVILRAVSVDIRGGILKRTLLSTYTSTDGQYLSASAQQLRFQISAATVYTQCCHQIAALKSLSQGPFDSNIHMRYETDTARALCFLRHGPLR